MGIAAFFTHQTYFAEVADVSVDSQNRITVHQIWAAGDVGSQVINPSCGGEPDLWAASLTRLSQMEQEITLAKGAVEQDELPLANRCCACVRRPRSRFHSVKQNIRHQALANPCCRQ